MLWDPVVQSCAPATVPSVPVPLPVTPIHPPFTPFPSFLGKPQILVSLHFTFNKLCRISTTFFARWASLLNPTTLLPVITRVFLTDVRPHGETFFSFLRLADSHQCSLPPILVPAVFGPWVQFSSFLLAPKDPTTTSFPPPLFFYTVDHPLSPPPKRLFPPFDLLNLSPPPPSDITKTNRTDFSDRLESTILPPPPFCDFTWCQTCFLPSPLPA